MNVIGQIVEVTTEEPERKTSRIADRADNARRHMAYWRLREPSPFIYSTVVALYESTCGGQAAILVFHEVVEFGYEWQPNGPVMRAFVTDSSQEESNGFRALHTVYCSNEDEVVTKALAYVEGKVSGRNGRGG